MTKPIVEIGWIIAGKLDEVDLKAVHQAHKDTLAYLQETFPEFEWRIPLLRRDELVTSLNIEPATLLDDALTERNFRHWDATILITAADLVSLYKPGALGVLSRSLEAIIVSTRRIDPRRETVMADDEQREKAMAVRVRALVLFALGRLWGLSNEEDPSNWMHPTDTINDLDKPNHWTEEQIELLKQSLHNVADVRLEETSSSSRQRPLYFYISSAWINRGQILQAVRKAEPWKFPFRLSRLTAASVSAMFILLVTAEVWELGMVQHWALVFTFALVVTILTTWYVLIRQGLLVQRQRQRLTEQNVVTNLCTVTIVLLGIVTTHLLLFSLTLILGGLLYQPSLLAKWAESVKEEINWFHYLMVAGLVATLGILVGALGASFEGNRYFRHVTFVDEEL